MTLTGCPTAGRRVLTAMLIAAAIAALAGCGDGTQDDGQATGQPAQRATDTAKPSDPWADSASWPKPDFEDPNGAPDEILIREVITDVQRDFPAKVGSGVCFELTPAGRREIVETGIGVYRTCTQIVPDIVRRLQAAKIGPRFSEVLDVTIDGKRATALIQDGSGAPYGVPLVKLPEVGWKLPSLTLVEPVDMNELAGLKPDSIDPRITSDKVAITEVLADVQSDFAAGFAYNACDELTQTEAERVGRLPLAKGGDCDAALNELYRRMRKQSVERWSWRIVAIKIHGNRAVATVADRTGSGLGRRKVRFLKEKQRDWQLVSLAEVEPVAEVVGGR